ncbi:MAG: sulfatase-like hydrolase/transferase, partial [Candidatus Rokuibacteriota bacterium]
MHMPGLNVVLVIFDTLRLDAVGCYGTPPPWGPIATPNLDRFAKECVRFTRAYPESLPTLCARRAIYTGQRTYPFHN